MHDRMRPAAATLSFLTAVPLAPGGIGERDLARGAALFPIVGAAIGASVAAVVWSASQILPALPAAVLGIAAGVAITGALHLDGLGDVADGIGAALAGREPADAMRDPGMGTFGVAAVALDLLLRASVIASLGAERFPWEIAAAGALARVAPVALSWRLPYVGRGSGAWTSSVTAWSVVLASGCALAIAVPLARAATMGMALVGAAVAIPLTGWSRRRLGGVTGDVFGAAAELTETLALVVALAALG